MFSATDRLRSVLKSTVEKMNTLPSKRTELFGLLNAVNVNDGIWAKGCQQG